jgi:hypothetical protein
MKTKQKSKSRKKLHSRKPVRKKSGRTAKKRLTGAVVRVKPPPSDVKIKACEELEIGDIGGFGSIEELESHENRCSQPATQLCTACRRNLCGTHYELLHRDHDSGQQSERKETLARA